MPDVTHRHEACERERYVSSDRVRKLNGLLVRFLNEQAEDGRTAAKARWQQMETERRLRAISRQAR